MFPSVTILNRTIYMYPIMALLGIFAMGIYVCRLCRKSNKDDNDAIVFLLLVAAGVYIGGQILYLLVNIDQTKLILEQLSAERPFTDNLRILSMLFGGSVFYGGLLGGLLTAFIYLLKKPEQRYLVDFSVPAIPLFHFFGRIGCFLGGCCFGVESHIGFTFHNSLVAEANGVSRFPVQLLEALFNVLLFLLLDRLRKKNLFKNRLLFVYLLLYSAGRFLIEFLRGDMYRGFLLSLSTSQVISIFLFCAALFVIFRDNLIKRKSAA